MKKWIIIKHAALQYPDGKVYLGRDHGECFRKANREAENGIEQGFVDISDKFVGRKEAALLITESGQVSKVNNMEMLFSEDIVSRGGPYNGLCDYDPETGYYFRN